VRQIPSESFLKVAHSLEQLKGVLFDKFFWKRFKKYVAFNIHML
jgi:hypothetical protein